MINFWDAFNEFVKGQKIVGNYYVEPYGTAEKKFYGEGIKLENGYKYIQHGGGCAGEDCNNSFIIDSEDNLVATYEW